MPDLTTATPLPLARLKTDLLQYKTNPSEMQRIIIDHLSAATAGQVELVDPTNPFVFLMESCTVCVAAAISESEINLRRQYPALAQTEDELYPHLCDKDFIGRFATPAVGQFTFMIQYAQLLNQLQPAIAEGCRKATIARNTTVTINGLVFSLQYPIDIRYYPSGALQITYDARNDAPLQILQTNVIDHEVRTAADGIAWVFFTVPLAQFCIVTAQYPVKASSKFQVSAAFSNHYVLCRVFCKATPTGHWMELRTTHTDQVYDPFVPTAVLQVTGQQVTVSIPQIYINQQQIDGTIRVDVYTTQGALNLNMANYMLAAFQTQFLAIDPADYSVYTTAMANTLYLAYSDSQVTGGAPALSFAELRTRVIQNAIGARSLPITNIQLDYLPALEGFELIRNVDVLTNRIFLAVRTLETPASFSALPVADLTSATLITRLEALANHTACYSTGSRITLPSNTLCLLSNGQLRLCTAEEHAALLALPAYDRADRINAANYYYVPFHYVFDNSLDEFELRAYALDAPVANELSFESKNTSTELSVNTASYRLQRTPTGYCLQVLTKSDALYQALDDRYVAAQLAYRPVGETVLAYVNATLYGRSSGERIFEFALTTDFDLTATDLLALTNFRLYSTEAAITRTPLSHRFTVLYTTASIPPGYQPDAASALVGQFLFTEPQVLITQESMRLTFGSALRQLWTQCRTVAGGGGYQTYTENIPAVYADDVYARDPITQAVFSVVDNTLTYTLLHRKGSPVTLDDGTPVYQHAVGDPVLDNDGRPIPIAAVHTERHCDLLLVEGSYLFATAPFYAEYRAELAATVATWITGPLAEANTQLLEQTKVFFYPKNSSGMLNALCANNEPVSVPAAQAFEIDLYVPVRVVADVARRSRLEALTAAVFTTALRASTVSMSAVIGTLRAAYGDDVVSVRVRGLGGAADYETLTLLREQDRFCIKKTVAVTEAGQLAVTRALQIQFIPYTV